MTRLGWVIAGVLCLLGVGIGLWQWSVTVTTLTVAVGPATSDDSRVIAAFAKVMARQDEGLRLRVMHTAGPAESAAAISAGKVDLAVIRSDIDAPSNASTIAVLRRDLTVVVARADSRVARIPDLVGKRVGIGGGQNANRLIFEQILRFYDIDPASVAIIELGPGQGQSAFQEGQIDALVAIAPTEAQGLANAISAAGLKGGGAPVFVPIREAAAIALRFPAMQPSDILRGAFGGEPPKPAENLQTLAVTRRLMAANQLSDTLVADLTRVLFQQRVDIERETRAAASLEAPETDRGQVMPTHPGAIAYLDGEEQTFLERNGDYVYLGAMLMSLFGSLAVALWSRAAEGRRLHALEGLNRLLLLLARARVETDSAALDAIEHEADEILAATLAAMGEQNLNEAGLAAYRMAFDQVGRAVGERRRILALAQQRAARPA